MTVNEYFAPILRDELFDALSDGELKMHELWRRYAYWEELSYCVRWAIDAMGDREVDRRTLGDIMGKAMEYLRSNYRENAPKPWLPVMKKLRDGGNVRWGLDRVR